MDEMRFFLKEAEELVHLFEKRLALMRESPFGDLFMMGEETISESDARDYRKEESKEVLTQRIEEQKKILWEMEKMYDEKLPIVKFFRKYGLNEVEKLIILILLFKWEEEVPADNILFMIYGNKTDVLLMRKIFSPSAKLMREGLIKEVKDSFFDDPFFNRSHTFPAVSLTERARAEIMGEEPEEESEKVKRDYAFDYDRVISAIRSGRKVAVKLKTQTKEEFLSSLITHCIMKKMDLTKREMDILKEFSEVFFEMIGKIRFTRSSKPQRRGELLIEI